MKKTILQLNSITKNYNTPGFMKKDKPGIPAIDDISLSLYEGEILGLIGESGSGKTTVGKSILKLMGIDSGSIQLFGNDITNLTENKFRAIRGDIQMIFQDLDAALNPNMKIDNILIEIVRRHHKTNKIEARKQALKLISDVHLEPEILDRYPGELSGGQKRRIAIASALAAEPRIIIADEPTTGLDNYTQTLIMKLILDLQKSRNLSMILISHDLQLIKKMCRRVAVMYLGSIVEIGLAEEISQSPAHPYSSLLWQSHLKHTTNTGITERQHNIRSGLFDFARPSHGCRFAPRCKRYLELDKPEKCTLNGQKPILKPLHGDHKEHEEHEEHEAREEHTVACYFPL